MYSASSAGSSEGARRPDIRLDIEFPAERTHIGELRRWVKAAVPLLGLDGRQREAVLDDVRLVLSELGANAVVHGCGGERPDVVLTASLRFVAGVLRVSVTDPGLGRPEYRSADSAATRGRGLMLVTALASRFGVEGLPGGGKEIWAEIGLPEPARSTVDGRRESAGLPAGRGSARGMRPRRSPGAGGRGDGPEDATAIGVSGESSGNGPGGSVGSTPPAENW